MPCLPNRRQWHTQLAGSLLKSHDPGGLSSARCPLIRTPSSHSRWFQSTCRSFSIQFPPTSQLLLGLCSLSPLNVPGPCSVLGPLYFPPIPSPSFFTRLHLKRKNKLEKKEEEESQRGQIWAQRGSECKERPQSSEEHSGLWVNSVHCIKVTK